MLNETRYTADIGMYASDRPRNDVMQGDKVLARGTCHWRTEACKGCYNEKLERVFKAMIPKDVKNEIFWQQLDGDKFNTILSRKRKDTSRFRFQTRGETFASIADVLRVKDILKKNPDTIFWMPTRAWRNPFLKNLIESHIFPLANARTLASTDIYTHGREWKQLKETNWPTMFFGNDDLKTTPNGDKFFLCPKTHKDLKGHCGICKAGCFRNNKRVDVHLKQH